jgi:hypothetical protein
MLGGQRRKARYAASKDAELATVSLRDLDKVDLVSRSKDSGEYMLVIVIDEPWQDSDAFRARILEKLNNYCTYFLDGQMYREYPDCQQQRMPVRLSSIEEIPEYAREYVSRLSDAFKQHRLDVEAKQI